jgi:hypothetical protein
LFTGVVMQGIAQQARDGATRELLQAGATLAVEALRLGIG